MKLFFINTETSFPEGRWLGQTHCHDYACFVVQTTSFHFFCAQTALGCIESVGSLKTKLHLYLSFLLIVVISTQSASEL